MSTIDQIALDTVQAIAGIDPDKLKGGKGQAMAQAQCLVIDAMKQAGAPDMRPIALKKLSQMGATVHGVLAKNEVGRWVAVSEAGRVMWLDNFEGQSSSAQGEPSGGVSEGWKLVPVEPTRGMADAAHSEFRVLHGVMTYQQMYRAMIAAAPTAPAVQGGGMPVAYQVYWYESAFDLYEAPLPAFNDEPQQIVPLYTHPHNGEQGGEWRSPSDLRDDVDVRVKLKDGSVIENCLSQSDGDFYWKGGGTEMFILEHEVVGWMPQPPKSKEGES